MGEVSTIGLESSCQGAVHMTQDVSRLNDRPPLFDLGLLIRDEGFGSLLFAREYLLAYLGEPLTNRWVGESIHDRGIEFSDDAGRSALGAHRPDHVSTCSTGTPA
jgi:hypothetical protein